MTSEQERQAAFQREYNALVNRYGFRLVSAIVQTESGGQQLISPVIEEVAGWTAPADEDGSEETES